MNFKELAAYRYSVRNFKPTMVEKEKLDIVLEAGRNAPTAANKQPQRIIVVSTEEGCKKIDESTRFRYGAPVVLLICFDKNESWKRPYDDQTSGWVDASIAATQMILQAADLGLGTTWVMYFDPAKLIAEFGLPENIVPVAMLPLGYPVDDDVPSEHHYKRQPREKLVFFENL
jgi:nitroreductase